jgi:NAD(P)H-flavin reductase
MLNNPYKPIKAKIESIIDETPTIKTFVLRPEEKISFAAGQFMQVSLPGIGEAPFTPSSSMYATETLEFSIMKAGSVTSLLHQAKIGDTVGLRGPLGNGYYKIDEWKDREIFIVGGGVGLAPLRALLFALFHNIQNYKKIFIRFGARSPQDIAYKALLEEWKNKEKVDFDITVDRGDNSWGGKVGIVTTILENTGVNPQDAVGVVCGPPIMMKFVTQKMLDLGLAADKINLSMEKNMSCGVGMCFHCNVGPYLACKDGPVFTWEQIKNIPDPW